MLIKFRGMGFYVQEPHGNEVVLGVTQGPWGEQRMLTGFPDQLNKVYLYIKGGHMYR